MNAQQKLKLIQWQSGEVYRLPDSSKIRLDDLIKSSRNKYNLVNEYAIPLLMDSIHPTLYYYFVIDWSKFPSSRVPQGFKDSMAFGRHVNETWLAVCNRFGYFRDGLLENYQTIDQLRDNIDLLLGKEAPGKLFYPDGFVRMEEQLNIMRDSDIEQEAKREAERQAQEEVERQLREAEAKRKQEEADKKKKKKQADHDAEVKANQEFHDKEGSPWTQDNTVQVSDGSTVGATQHKHTVHAGPGSSIERQMQLLQSDFYEFYKLTIPDFTTVHIDIHFSGKKNVFSMRVHAFATDQSHNRCYNTGRLQSLSDCLINAENHLFELVSDREETVRKQREDDERQKKKAEMQKKIDEAEEQMRKFQEQRMAEIKKMREELNAIS